MTTRLHCLLALLPEHEREAVRTRALARVTVAIAKECEIVDEAMVRMIGELVEECLDE